MSWKLIVPASGRSLFAFPASTEVIEEKLDLRDIRTSTSIVQGPAGLDAQGLTSIQHRSALSDQSWFSGTNIEDVYFPEVCKLLCRVTDAKHAMVNNCAFRRKHVENQNDPTFYLKKDGPLDKELAKQNRDTPNGLRQGGGR